MQHCEEAYTVDRQPFLLAQDFGLDVSALEI